MSHICCVFGANLNQHHLLVTTAPALKFDAGVTANVVMLRGARYQTK